jgi:hypothetical protein
MFALRHRVAEDRKRAGRKFLWAKRTESIRRVEKCGAMHARPLKSNKIGMAKPRKPPKKYDDVEELAHLQTRAH